jgi:hypothetical protein
LVSESNVYTNDVKASEDYPEVAAHLEQGSTRETGSTAHSLGNSNVISPNTNLGLSQHETGKSTEIKYYVATKLTNDDVDVRFKVEYLAFPCTIGVGTGTSSCLSTKILHSPIAAKVHHVGLQKNHVKPTKVDNFLDSLMDEKSQTTIPLGSTCLLVREYNK